MVIFFLTFVVFGVYSVWTDPMQRMTLEAVSMHSWVTEYDGLIPQYICWCRRNKLRREESDGIRTNTISNIN